MSGVIDEDGTQWERCNGCTNFERIEDLFYEQPIGQFKYGRDLCWRCHVKSLANPGCIIEPDPAAVAARQQAAAKIKEEMQGKEWVFTQSGPNTWDCHQVSVN